MQQLNIKITLCVSVTERERDVTKNRERGERKSCEIVKDDFHTSTLFSVFSKVVSTLTRRVHCCCAMYRFELCILGRQKLRLQSWTASFDGRGAT